MTVVMAIFVGNDEPQQSSYPVVFLTWMTSRNPVNCEKTTALSPLPDRRSSWRLSPPPSLSSIAQCSQREQNK